MKDKKHTTESADAVYRTGDTHPPKSRGGVIAFLLALVIFLSGISTALGLMNIRLFQKLSDIEATQPSPVAFSHGEDFEVSHNAVSYPLGFAGQAVPDFWQTYHQLPPGIYVVEVTQDDEQQLLPGDIITQLEGVPLTGEEDLNALLKDRQPGTGVDAVVYRRGKDLPVTLTIQED